MPEDLQVTQQSGDGSIVVAVPDGRRLTLLYPGPLAQYKLVLAMGADNADNTRFVSMCLPLIYLSAIDENPVMLPTTMLQIEALIGRLGHAGLKALQDGIKQFDKKDDPEEAKK